MVDRIGTLLAWLLGRRRGPNSILTAEETVVVVLGKGDDADAA